MSSRYSNFSISYFGDIEYTNKVYSRTASGKGWKTNPDTIETETVYTGFYNNYVQSIPFFNNFGGRSRCRAQWNYTRAGYIPTVITTVSYDGTEKHITEFKFN